MEIGKLMKSFCCTTLGIRVVTCSHRSNSEFYAALTPTFPWPLSLPGSLECNVSAIILIISKARSPDPLPLLLGPTLLNKCYLSQVDWSTIFFSEPENKLYLDGFCCCQWLRPSLFIPHLIIVQYWS